MSVITIGHFLGLNRFLWFSSILSLEQLPRRAIILYGLLILQFGLLGICDGHGGAGAAISVSQLVFHFMSLINIMIIYCRIKMVHSYLLAAIFSLSRVMPQMVANILSDSFRREKVLSQCDASDVLREAFSQTEASINHYYEVSTQHIFSLLIFFMYCFCHLIHICNFCVNLWSLSFSFTSHICLESPVVNYIYTVSFY